MQTVETCNWGKINFQRIYAAMSFPVAENILLTAEILTNLSENISDSKTTESQHRNAEDNSKFTRFNPKDLKFAEVGKMIDAVISLGRRMKAEERNQITGIAGTNVEV